MEEYVRPILSHSNSFGNDAEKDTAGWLTDKDELKIVADTAQKVASAILSNLAASGIAAFADLKDE